MVVNSSHLKECFLRFSILMPLLVSSTIAFSQNIPRPKFNAEVTRQGSSTTSNRFTAQKVIIDDIKFTDTSYFSTLSLIKSKTIEENKFNNDFYRFKKNNKLNYTEEETKLKEKVPFPLSMKYGIDSNVGDGSIPLDNSVASSCDDYVISMTNGFVEFYKENKKLDKIEIGQFFGYRIDYPCDPKVIFDPTENKFIVFAQSCSGYSNSKIIIGFSSSSNPVEKWNFYTVSGNPENRPNHWFDYPKIGLSSSNLFVSGNIFKNRSFIKTVVYQFDKIKGYNGAPLDYRVWSDIPENPVVLMPVSHGFDRSYGPGIFLIGTTWENGANHLKLYEITGDIGDSSLEINYYKVNTVPYNFFAEAVQKGDVKIDNGDIRIQDAVYYNNNIYFTFTSGDSRNFSRINVNALSIPDLRNNSILLGGLVNTSYAFPSLNLVKDPQGIAKLLIQFNSTSITQFPSIGISLCDLNLNCGEEIRIVEGKSNIEQDRWGDYSAITNHCDPDKGVWLSSSYGSGGNRQSFLSNLVFTQVLKENPSVSAVKKPRYESIVFPLAKDQNVSIKLIDSKVTREIAQKKALRGTNVFYFDSATIPAGDYDVQVISNDDSKIIFQEKLKIKN